MSNIIQVVFSFAAGVILGGIFAFVWGSKHGKSLAAAEAKLTSAEKVATDITNKL